MLGDFIRDGEAPPMLEFKPDWDEASARRAAWYQCEVIDRCAIAVTAPRDGATPNPPTKPPTLDEQWTNVDYQLDKAEERLRTTWFGGEACPDVRMNLGPHAISAWLGAKLVFMETTSWTEPIIDDWDTFGPLTFDPNNRWWQWMLTATQRAAERGAGRFITSICDIHGGGDAIASLRGNENFCMDLVLNPEHIRTAEAFLRAMWFEVCETLLDISTRRGQEGTGGFLGWGPGRTVPLQDDVLALISPAMVEEFLLQALVDQCEWLDSSVFHLDGPESLPSLDLLLDLPKLHGIQWQPGAAHYPMTNWIPLLRRIQQAGKCVHISAQADEVETLLAELPAAGLLIHTHCATEAEGHALLKKTADWTR